MEARITIIGVVVEGTLLCACFWVGLIGNQRETHSPARSSSREVRIRVPFFSLGYFSRGTLPPKKGREGHQFLGDLVYVPGKLDQIPGMMIPL